MIYTEITKFWELKQELALIIEEKIHMDKNAYQYMVNGSDRYYQSLRNKELELRKEFLAIQIDDAEMTRIFRRIWRKKLIKE